MKSNYKRLGDLINPVSIKNTEMVTDDLRGVNYQKYFMPSVANTNGVDLSGYKLVCKGQFACNLMHVGRDECLPIALHREDKPIIVSPAYFSFEVKNENEILSEFLFLWFKRAEFDREACFYTDADVRQGLIKSSFMDIQVPVPPIEVQRKIVEEYQAVERRIENNRRLIATLEATAQTIYRKMFVDNIDPSNLPLGWRMGKFTEVFNLGGGGTPSTNNPTYWNNAEIGLFSPEDVKTHKYVVTTARRISKEGLAHCNSPLYPSSSTFLTVRGSVGKIGLTLTPMAMNQSCYCISLRNNNSPYYTFCSTIHYVEIFRHQAVGAVFNAMVTKDFESIDIVVCPNSEISKFEKLVTPLFFSIKSHVKEINGLQAIHSLLLSKLSNL